ncbi:MAG: HD family hydrolase [Rhodospirillales bacterium]|nr:MAG: HD family hydrolase [Rhodospirillales bacterium]
MLSGRRLDILDPSPIDIEVEDIAHGLSRVARWNGQTSGDWAYSVAQHSLLVEAIAAHRGLAERWRRAALLHDAPEYVIGDLITPFKAVVGPAYKGLEDRLAQAIRIRFGLPATLPKTSLATIKSADRAAAFLEATRLAGFDDTEARRYFGRAPMLPQQFVDPFLSPWPPSKAKRLFLARFTALEA